MPDILFICSECDKRLAVDTKATGQTLACTDCGAAVTVPAAALFFPCPGCGAELAASEDLAGKSAECPECGEEIAMEAEQAEAVEDEIPVEEEIPVEASAPEVVIQEMGPPRTLPELPPVEKSRMPTIRAAVCIVILLGIAFGLGLMIPRGTDPEEEEPTKPAPREKTQPKPTKRPARPAKPAPVRKKPAVPAKPPSEAAKILSSKIKPVKAGPIEAPPIDPKEFGTLKSSYDEAVASVRDVYGSLDEDALKTYAANLLKLQKEYETKGDLKSWLAARIERDRIVEQPKQVKTPPPTKIVSVTALHTRFLGSIAENRKLAGAELSTLTQAYVKDLRRINAGLNETYQPGLKQKITAEIARVSH